MTSPFLLSFFFILWIFSPSSAFQSPHERWRINTPPSSPSSMFEPSYNKQRIPIGVSSIKSYRLAANKDSTENNIQGFPIALPTLNQVVFAWLFFVSANRLFTSFPNYFAGDNDLLTNIAFNGIFCFGSIFGLAKSFAKIDYESLDGFDLKSLARQSGQWAISDTVPRTYEQYNVATFAGGCFWGTELHYQRIPGVIATCIGYTQGAVDRPGYEQVCSGTTGHTESIQLIYDTNVVSYERLLNKLFDTINPTLLNQVGNDKGTQYRHGIYYHTDEQLDVATQFIAEKQSQYLDPIVTQVNSATIFFPAENYHQRYLEKGGQSAEKECEEKVRCYG